LEKNQHSVSYVKILKITNFTGILNFHLFIVIMFM